MKKMVAIGLGMMLAVFLDMKTLSACMGGGGGHGGGTTAQESMMGHGGHKGQPIEDQNQAKQLLEDHLKSTGNPNLKLGKLSEEQDYFEAEITTKDGSLVDKIRVNKDTGSLESAYQGTSRMSGTPEGHQGHGN